VTARFLFFLNLLFNVEDTRFLGYFQATSSEVGLHPIELTPDLPPFSLVLEGEGQVLEEEGYEDQPIIFFKQVGQSADFSRLTNNQVLEGPVPVINRLPYGTVPASICFNQLESFGGLLLPTAKLSSLLSVSTSEVEEFFAQTKANLVFFGPTIRTIDASEAPTVLLSQCTRFTINCLQLNRESNNRLSLTITQGSSSSEPLLGNLLFDALLLAAFFGERDQQIVDIFPTLEPPFLSSHPSHFLLKFFPSRFQVTPPHKASHTASFPNFVVEESPNNGDPNNPDFFFYSRFTENLRGIFHFCRLEQDIDWLNETLQGNYSDPHPSGLCRDREKNFLLSLEETFNRLAWAVLVNYFGLQLRP
jgi:hypothetical protein